MRAAASLPLSPRTYTAMPACGGRSAAPHRTTVYSTAAQAPASVAPAGSWGEAAAAGEQPLVEGAQAIRSAMDVSAAGGLTGVAVRLERRDDGVDVAGGERTLVRRDVRALLEAGVGLEQGRADRVAAGQ